MYLFQPAESWWRENGLKLSSLHSTALFFGLRVVDIGFGLAELAYTRLLESDQRSTNDMDGLKPPL